MSVALQQTTIAPVRRPVVFLDRVNPVTKIVAAVILSVPLFASIDWVSALVAVVIELSLFALAGLRFTELVRRIAPVLLFAPIAGISMLLYGEPGGTVYASFWFATISDNSIQLAIAITLRVLALGLPTILLFARVDPTELADALSQVAKLPSRFVLGVLAGTRMIGLFLEDWRSMELARRARGVGDSGTIRRFLSMSFVLLVFAVRRGTKLAVAMEARGFGSSITRTWARPSQLGWRDPVVVIAALGIMAIALGAAVAAGTFRFIGS
ncbi:energy-coupling factor transporter transmembrane component T family protein [Agromyces atrinae]|uniref:Energy-coupling factor transport system permease protein n=1 Tax=Agromyces atrinae TaxID=592376 RepID=A0A4Q2M517_9MICO|nr:energy-coupling factor transporter transmembrane component T [Agromyces atrinae]NYD66520.1 energy-coupling factor transport system permease protein [Agromyces atrinae]RXZ87194.1 energy-coupling factor transporter transmembrane protein EcfT [Agromyces atrinae]